MLFLTHTLSLSISQDMEWYLDYLVRLEQMMEMLVAEKKHLDAWIIFSVCVCVYIIYVNMGGIVNYNFSNLAVGVRAFVCDNLSVSDLFLSSHIWRIPRTLFCFSVNVRI